MTNLTLDFQTNHQPFVNMILNEIRNHLRFIQSQRFDIQHFSGDKKTVRLRFLAPFPSHSTLDL